MKKFTLSILALIGITLSSNAQVVEASWAPSPYAGLLRNHVENVSGFGPGAEGSGQSWDFSSLNSDSTSLLEFIDPADLDGFDDFSNATTGNNLVFNDSIYASVFYNASASAWQVLGTISFTPMANVTLNYTDPMDLLRFPVGFGQAFSDSFNISVEGGFISFSEIGENVVTVDGSGTLITPAGTFNNVLRIKSIETSQAIGLPPVPGGPTTSETTSYLFISAEFPSVPLLEYRVSGDNINPNADTTITFADPSYQTIAEKSTNKISVYPNPASNQVTVSTDASFERFEILDLFGRVVLVEPVTKNSLNTVISTTSIKSGVYFVRGISVNGKSFVKRISITH